MQHAFRFGSSNPVIGHLRRPWDRMLAHDQLAGQSCHFPQRYRFPTKLRGFHLANTARHSAIFPLSVPAPRMLFASASHWSVTGLFASCCKAERRALSLASLPGRKFSMTMSASAMSANACWMPSGTFRSMLTMALLRLSVAERRGSWQLPGRQYIARNQPPERRKAEAWTVRSMSSL